MALLDALFQTDGYTPHGYCLLWDPALIWLHLVSDSAVALAYLAIPAALATVGRRRPDLNPYGVLYWFAAFIILCALRPRDTYIASFACCLSSARDCPNIPISARTRRGPSSTKG